VVMRTVSRLWLLLASQPALARADARVDRELLVAVARDDEIGIRQLVQQGANAAHRITDNDKDLVQGVNDVGDSATALMLAVAHGHQSAASTLIELSAEVDDAITSEADGRYEYTALMIAACQGREAMAELIVRAGASLNYPPSLGCAAIHGHAATTRILLAAGASIPTLILHELVLCKAAKCIETLILLIQAGADVNELDKDGLTPLVAAAWNGSTEMVSALLAAGADANAAEGAALQSAALNGNLATVQALLEGGAQPDWEADASRGSALFRAASEGHVDVVHLLIHWAGRVDARGLLQRTPLMVAAGSGKDDVVRLLIDANASVNEVDATGDTAMHFAAERKKGDWSHTRRAKFRCAMALLEVGAKPDPLGYERVTPLMLAAQAGDRSGSRLISALLDRGANVEMRSVGDVTALMDAAKHGNFFGAKLLINAGANVNAKSAGGSSPLMYSALEMATLDVHALDSLGRQKLVRLRNVTELLLSSGAKRPSIAFVRSLRDRGTDQAREAAELICSSTSLLSMSERLSDLMNRPILFLWTCFWTAVFLVWGSSGLVHGLVQQKRNNNARSQNARGSAAKGAAKRPPAAKGAAKGASAAKGAAKGASHHRATGNGQESHVSRDPAQGAPPRAPPQEVADDYQGPVLRAGEQEVQEAQADVKQPQELPNPEEEAAAGAAAAELATARPSNALAPMLSDHAGADGGPNASNRMGKAALASAIVQAEDECCVVCMDRPPTHIFGPCGHHCTCLECGDAIMKSPDQNCPICRKRVHVFMRVFSVGS